MSRYALTAPAKRDFNEIVAFLAENAGVTIARRVLNELRAAMRVLAKQPGVGHTREDLADEPLRFFAVYSYLIVYDPTKKPLEITRILHGARDVRGVL
ncbi:MAG: type II toxin-antitoxin system RelE/ParE family toxin [Acidobacteria bacterium]|nr:type II toxin-antitoxin system RelE/ParE family toxin [Acidobacteriota bacterium]